MIKALFFDIDGTLVSFKTHQIPESTVEALALAKEKGVKVFISTGRPFPLINNLDAIKNLIDGYITTNGAYCFIGDDIISCNDIQKEDVNTVIAESKRVRFPCMVVGEKDLTMYNTESNPDLVMKISKLLNIPGIDLELPIDSVTSQRIIQLTPFISESQESSLLLKLRNIESGRWCPDFSDFTAKGVNKAKGLKEIAKRCNLDVFETMAFGDGGNDLSIVKAAGIGVAMGNANEILKTSADYITTSVDDNGIYNALKVYNVI